jgi:hypothetical protein
LSDEAEGVEADFTVITTAVCNRCGAAAKWEGIIERVTIVEHSCITKSLKVAWMQQETADVGGLLQAQASPEIDLRG